MKSKSVKIKNLLSNSLILSLPGFVSIFLSILSIPVHLKIAGIENYGDYLLFHILLNTISAAIKRLEEKFNICKYSIELLNVIVLL